MAGFYTHLEKETLENDNFRKVIFTAENCQLVLMSLLPEEEIGEETHQLDQFIRVESGEGKSIVDGEEHLLIDGDAIVVPAGAKHNIINTSASEKLKLYTVYSPPEHKDGTIHVTRQDALKDEEDHFEGKE